jgi:hypothetical protein
VAKKKVFIMVCTSPISLPKNPNLKFRCRKCLSCQITKRQEWAMRCVMESQVHKQNCFITLTYNDKYNKVVGSDKTQLQRFIKRLRKKIYPKKVKYVACYEYGEGNGSREWWEHPHFHILLFGYDFDDKVYLKRTRKGEIIYTSPTLESLWTDPHFKDSYGMSSVGTLTHSSASYVAGYVHKKFNGYIEDEIKHYMTPYGQVMPKEQIYCSQGIAKDFFEKHKNQLYNHDYVMYQGKKYALPEYFNYRLREHSENKDYDILKFRRAKHKKELSEQEAKAKDYILKQKFSKNRSLKL